MLLLSVQHDAAMTVEQELNGSKVVKAITTCHLQCIDGVTHGTNWRVNLDKLYFDGKHYIWVSFYVNHPVEADQYFKGAYSFHHQDDRGSKHL